jgi:type 1 glutamine amidotransferase
MMQTAANTPCEVMLIAGGKYHDIDFARLELLKLLAEDERRRVSVYDNYEGGKNLGPDTVLITYTCDVIPDAVALKSMRQWLEAGGRWFALHGTNSILEFTSEGRVAAPDRAPEFMALRGSRVRAQPPSERYTVTIADREHPLTRGLADFETLDEQYLSQTASGLHVLLDTRFAGRTPNFTASEWPDARHPVMYLNRVGRGEVLYLTLGHCRGHFDMQPLVAYWPNVQRCSWDLPEYYELLRRGVAWATTRREHRSMQT